jgi:[ribosomal protein S5]-alanine N-acetyltransferase
MELSDHTVAETPRLTIRRLTPDDLDALASLLADPQVMRYSYSGPRSRDSARMFIERAMASYREENGRGTWALIRKSDGAFIGFCGYFQRETGGGLRDEIGYRLFPFCWNQGFATEAAAAVRDVAFEQYNVEKLHAAINDGNSASMRVAEKIGMRYEHDFEIDGRVMKIYAMSKL